jgi:crotonobetainyl-CoA:carnitine CoA-transferase CaiB-like acyl-CoA transferase
MTGDESMTGDEPATGDVLAGVTVVSLAVNVPGPVAVARLRALGADVTKVEPPSGDPLRLASEAWYASLTHGQRVQVVDLKSAEGRSALDDLLVEADVLVTSSRTSALQRLRLDWPSLSAQFDRLCHVEIVGDTESGDAGHDLTYQAANGTVRPPQLPTVLVADLAGAERTVAEVLAALLLRGRQGRGVHRVVALSDVAHDMAAAARHGLTAEGGPLAGALPAYGLYETADGWVAVAALEPHFWRRLCTDLDVDGSREELEEAFARRTARDWGVWARERDLPLVAVAGP